jgi:hypothetical protein
MIDPFVLLTPILLFGVMALLRFVGCDLLFGLPHVPTNVPTTTGIFPASGTVGDPDFLLTVSGSNFVQGSSKVLWKGSDTTNPTTFVSTTELNVTITTAEVATEGTATVAVFTPGEDGGTSNPQYFTIATSVTVTFNNPGMPDDPLMGTYDNKLDFNYAPPQEWHFKGSGNGTSIYVGPANMPNNATGTFTFHNAPPSGRKLRQIIVSADTLDGTLTFNDEQGQQFVTPMIIAGAPPIPIPVIWNNPTGMPSLSISVTATAGSAILISAITYEGPV